MRKFALLPGFCLLLLFGCEKKPERSYAALDQSGMFSTNIDELKKLNVTDLEVGQLAKLKQAGASDELCLSLFKAAHAHNHDFTSGDSAVNLSRAGYSDSQILGMAQTDQIDLLSGDAITLKLIGLSNSTVQEIVERRIQGLPTLTSEQIGRLKNTGQTEKQILALVEQGLTGAEADKKIAQLEGSRNHSNTGFVRNQGRRRH
ncbi:MAG TPA: hypothetical protein VII25_10865 [Candidatus Acidoferrum sp.]|jgi:hypothetical protein